MSSLSESLSSKSKLHYIFDVDGTLIGDVNGRPANTPDEVYLLPNVAQVTRRLREEGHTLSLASNKGGVAFGFMSPQTAYAIMKKTARLVGAERFEFCIHHPKGTVPEYKTECNLRKPNPGMLHKLIMQSGIPPERTLYVGDHETDEATATAAGVQFTWAHTFFGWTPKT